MKIAIIGTGNVGSALARGFRRAGHDVILGSRRPEEGEVRTLAAETVALLAAELGFDPVDAGPLQRARHLEHLAVLWIHRAIATGNRRFGLALTQG